MLGRFSDAVKVLDSVVAPLGRLQKTHSGFPARALPPGSPPSEQVSKSFDRTLTLLAVASHLAQGGSTSSSKSEAELDDASRTALKDKFGDKLAVSEHRHDLPTHVAYLATLVGSNAPKFVVPSIPDYSSFENDDDNDDKIEDAKVTLFQRQMKLFSKVASQQLAVAKIKSYLQLYTSINVDKLASFNDKAPKDFSANLLTLKFTMLQKQASGNIIDSPLGLPTTSPDLSIDDNNNASKDSNNTLAAYKTPNLDLHFYVENNVVYVDEPQVQGGHRHEEFFLDQTNKYRRATNLLKHKTSYASFAAANGVKPPWGVLSGAAGPGATTGGSNSQSNWNRRD